MQYACTSKRIIAIVIDVFLILDLNLALNFFTAKNWYINVLNILICAAYLPLCWTFLHGGTLGNYLLRIRVRNVNGQRLALGNSILRELVLIFSGLGFFVSLPLILVSKQNQSLHDLASKSIVVDLSV